MIEYISLAGISKELREKMIEKNGENEVLDLACNHQRVKNNIELLKSIGIKNIEDLLLNKSEIFLRPTEDLISKLSNINIYEFVNLVNTDYNEFEEIL